MNKVFRVFLAALVTLVSLQAVAANEVSRVLDGKWSNPMQITGNGFGFQEWNLWFDVRVANLSPVKTVGIVWTDDAWATHRNAFLNYESTYPDGFEQWGVDIAPAGRFTFSRIASPAWTNQLSGITTANKTSVTIEYAIFYEVNGKTYWDNNKGQNYKVIVNSN